MKIRAVIFIASSLFHASVYALITASFLLSACAGSTYQKDGRTGGYTDTQLSPNVFRISFRGNGYTRPERADELALLRCADVTLLNGFTHFTIVDSQYREKHGMFTTGGQVYMTTEPSTTRTIMCFHGKPDTSSLIYDAAFICNSIGNKYKASCQSN
jgi:hypothetical protein